MWEGQRHGQKPQQTSYSVNVANHVQRLILLQKCWSTFIFFSFFNCLQISSETAGCYSTISATDDMEGRGVMASIYSVVSKHYTSSWENVCYELFNAPKNVWKSSMFHPEPSSSCIWIESPWRLTLYSLSCSSQSFCFSLSLSKNCAHAFLWTLSLNVSELNVSEQELASVLKGFFEVLHVLCFYSFLRLLTIFYTDKFLIF